MKGTQHRMRRTLYGTGMERSRIEPECPRQKTPAPNRPPYPANHHHQTAGSDAGALCSQKLLQICPTAVSMSSITFSSVNETVSCQMPSLLLLDFAVSNFSFFIIAERSLKELYYYFCENVMTNVRVPAVCVKRYSVSLSPP